MKRTKNIILVLLSVITASTIGFSQDEKKEIKKYIRAADLEMYNNNFKNALDLYRKAYTIDSANAQVAFKVGVCMYNFRKYKQQSLPYFEKAQHAGIPEASYFLGNLYHLSGKFEDAIRLFQEYKNNSGKKEFSNTEVDFLINKSKTAIELVKTPVDVTIENIGTTINTEYSEYVPLISADESILIFTSRRKGSTGGLLDPFGDYFEDVYISHKKKSVSAQKSSSEWTTPQGISSNINTPTHDACVGLSPNGEVLFLYRTSEDLLSGDLYASVFNGTEWSVPELLPDPINTKNFNEPSASLLEEGQILYFSSDRPGGYGKKDIYRVVKLGNGKWSKAVNLGPTINTPEDEDAPFIHPDGKTLYFSSEGHKNMGGYDIFKSTLKKADIFSEDIWSEPENLGYPVNTPDDDIYFVLSTDGKRGYYSSGKPGGYGSADIYLIHFAEENFGLDVLKGKVVADSSDKPLNATITLMIVADDSANNAVNSTITFLNSTTNKVEAIYNTNKLTGKFLMIIAENKKYIMKIEAEGYVTYTGKLNALSSEEINMIKLQKLEK
ncbi:MAG: PD40 domain-containing protein [Bacteroidetes bacterium]|nr:PD40 domain-containing protein [Bacteroidota bacterium]